MKLADIKKTNSAPLPRRIVLYGTHGIGKSTWAACAPDPVFIPTEDGLQDINTTAFPLAKSLVDVIEAISELAREDHPFKTAVIDSADWLERLVWQDVCEAGKKTSIEEFGYGKGYSSAATKFSEVLDGPAALSGLRPGDVITHLNNQAIDSAKTFTQVAQDLPKNRSVSMRVLRQGRASFITFKLAD
jgi:membrane-associated protease RseP (regulator of RpoE activity)